MVEEYFKTVGLRRKSRLLALNVLYLIDIAQIPIDTAINIVFAQYDAYPDSLKNFSSILITGTIQNLNLIDEIIQKYLKNWTIERMAIIDRNILRLSTFEFLCCVETPVNVIINEAIEIAKDFSTKDSGRFVNGLLDKIKLSRTDANLMKRFVPPEDVEKLKNSVIEIAKEDTNENGTTTS